MSFATMEIDMRIQTALQPIRAHLDQTLNMVKQMTNVIENIQRRLTAVEEALAARQSPKERSAVAEGTQRMTRGYQPTGKDTPTGKPPACGSGVQPSAQDQPAQLEQRVAELERDVRTWREAEYEARQKISECTLCPHLGCGDPSVDPQARRIQELEAQVEHVRKWAALQAGLSRVPISDVHDLIATLDSPLWNRRKERTGDLDAENKRLSDVIASVKRYDCDAGEHTDGCLEVEEYAEGDWVRWDDLRALLDGAR